jgi:hypothetical protein
VQLQPLFVRAKDEQLAERANSEEAEEAKQLFGVRPDLSDYFEGEGEQISGQENENAFELGR